jgi:RNA polymerase sigma-70 factor (ECF subfamily)
LSRRLSRWKVRLAADKQDVSTAPDDRALVSAVLRGRDEAAFRLLYQRHTATLYALALRLLGERRQDADDVLQETWIRAVTALPRFAWHSSLRTWLCSIVVNCCREVWRNARDELVIDEATVALQSGDVADQIDVATALARLPTGYRAVLVLHDIMGYTHEEIAAKLDIEAGTSKSQLSRARRAMRRALRMREPNDATRT